MNAESTIRELVQAHLADNHNVQGVEFMDRLLEVVAAVGKITCTLAGDGKWRFQTPDQPAWEVELGRALSKLRMLCARLAVLCNESGGQDVSLYGGEGVIKASSLNSAQHPAELKIGAKHNGPSLKADVLCEQAWTVRFKNTPSEQEFTIVSE